MMKTILTAGTTENYVGGAQNCCLTSEMMLRWHALVGSCASFRYSYSLCLCKFSDEENKFIDTTAFGTTSMVIARVRSIRDCFERLYGVRLRDMMQNMLHLHCINVAKCHCLSRHYLWLMNMNVRLWCDCLRYFYCILYKACEAY